MSVQSAGSESSSSWKSSASTPTSVYAGSWFSAEEDLLEQEQVERDDQGGQDAGERGEPGGVGHRPHHLALAGDQQQRDQCERDPEREHDLAGHQGVRRVEPEPEDDQG